MNSQAIFMHVIFAFLIWSVSVGITVLLINRLRILDIPNERSSHSVPVPRGGGLAIAISFLIGIGMVQLIGDVVPIRSDYFFGFVLSLLIISCVSLYDDIRCRNPKIKMISQILAIIIAMIAGNVIDIVYIPWVGSVTANVLLYPLTFVWLLGMTNSINFMDGLDGMAGSTAIVAGVFFGIIAFFEGSHFSYLMSIIMCMAVAGFLIFNWAPARIFMGDVGSTFIGFAFAVLAIIAARYDHGHTSLFVMPLLFFHFIFDTLFTFIRRLINKENVILAHRTHIYQLLNRLGYSHEKVSLIYSGLALMQGVAAVWMVSIAGEQRIFVFIPFFIGYMAAGLMIMKRANRAALL